MNSLLNFSKNFAIPAAFAFAAHFSATAQSPVESTHIDEKYAYTTVVYKNKAANDRDVLTMLESEFSIGDVVRVTLAPPPAPPSSPIAASEPVYADKRKGEDTWLPNATGTSTSLTAASDGLPNADKPMVVETEALPISAAPISSNAIAAAALKTVESERVVQETTAAQTAAQPVVKSSNAKTGKTAKAGKPSRKKFSTPKLKPRKKGKQGYACPKF